jgi:hypothetical protein
MLRQSFGIGDAAKAALGVSRTTRGPPLRGSTVVADERRTIVSIDAGDR